MPIEGEDRSGFHKSNRTYNGLVRMLLPTIKNPPANRRSTSFAASNYAGQEQTTLSLKQVLFLAHEQ